MYIGVTNTTPIYILFLLPCFSINHQDCYQVHLLELATLDWYNNPSSILLFYPSCHEMTLV